MGLFLFKKRHFQVETKMITTIRKIGNSAGILIPSIMLKELNLSVGSEIDLTAQNGVLTITPKKPRRGRSDASLRLAQR